MVDVSTLSIVLTGASVSIAAIYYVLTLRVTRRNIQTTLETRQAQLLMQIYQDYRGPEFRRQYNQIIYDWDWKDYDDWESKYGPHNNPEAAIALGSLSTFFEGIGVLVRHRLIDPKLVDDLISGPTISVWEKLEPIYREYRKRTGHLEAVEWFENLYNAIKSIRDKERKEKSLPTQ